MASSVSLRDAERGRDIARREGLLTRAIAAAHAAGLPVSIAEIGPGDNMLIGERSGTPSPEITFHLDRVSLTTLRLHRNPHVSEGTNRTSTEIDTFLLDKSEILGAVDAFMAQAVALLEQDELIKKAGGNVERPGPEWHRVHPFAAHLARKAGITAERAVEAAGDDEVERNEYGICGAPRGTTLPCGKGIWWHRYMRHRAITTTCLILSEPGRSHFSFWDDGARAHLEISGVNLPATVLGACVGKDLRDVADHPLFEGMPAMPIRTIENRQDRLSIDLDPGLVPVLDCWKDAA